MPEFEDLREWADISERDVLVLNTTMTCPLSCDFCCYGCHPGRSEKMPVDKAVDLIDQAADLPSFSSIGFTGGEPLVHEADFAIMTEAAYKRRMPYTVATSGFWGDSVDGAEAWANHMVSTGLSRMNISCDPSHTEFVKPSAVEHAAMACARRGVPVYIVGTFAEVGQSLKQFVPGLVDVKNIRLVDKIVAKTGRATKWVVDYDKIQTPKVKTCYRRVHHDLVVFWDGKAYPCCSTFNRATPGLVVGNAFEEPLKDIRNRVEASLLFRVLKHSGFPEFERILLDIDPELYAELPKFSDFPGACSTCNAVMKKPGVAERVYRAFDRYRTSEIMRSMPKIDSLLGEEKAAAFFEDMLTTCSDRKE